MIILYTKEQPVDYTEQGFYLDNQSKFCVEKYAKLAGINAKDIDADSVKSVVDAANNLPDWNTVKVEHY